MYQKKSWREKLADSKGLPKVGRITGRMSKRWGTGTLVIPAPTEVDAFMRQVPKGQLTTIDEIRTALAKKHKTDLACPLCTGIFAWIAAHAADEAAQAGEKKITPYWRTLKANGELNPKYPGGIPALKKLLAKEGHRVVAKGKRYFVESFENAQLGADEMSTPVEQILALRQQIRGFKAGPKIPRDELYLRQKVSE